MRNDLTRLLEYGEHDPTFVALETLIGQIEALPRLPEYRLQWRELTVYAARQADGERALVFESPDSERVAIPVDLAISFCADRGSRYLRAALDALPLATEVSA
jgi:hypothetical protein